jgi:anti-sigma28 factor (negative regulator of flagellin synthesis)
MNPHDIDGTDIEVILCLQKIQRDRGSVTQVEVSRELSISIKTVERRIRKIKESGWLLMIRDSGGRWTYCFSSDCPYKYVDPNPILESEVVYLSNLDTPSQQTAIISTAHSYTPDSCLYNKIISRNAKNTAANTQKPELHQQSIQENEMATPKVYGSDEGSMASLKQKIENGALLNEGRRAKKVGKPLSRIPDEFNREDSAFEKLPAKKMYESPASYAKSPRYAKEVEHQNCRTLWSLFCSLWEESKLQGYPIAWTNRERKHAKDLIDEQGYENVVAYFKYCFDNWRVLAHKFRIKSLVPDMLVLYGYRRSLVPEALNPKKQTAAPGAEYVAKDIPSGSWG